MPSTPPRRTRLVLTRRGRLVRTILVLILALVLVGAAFATWRAVGSHGASSSRPSTAASASASATSSRTSGGAASAAPPSSAAAPSASASATAAPGPAAEGGGDTSAMQHSGAVGDGTWVVTAPSAVVADDSSSVRTYALRVENGTGVDAAQASQIVAGVLADARGWQSVEPVHFVQVADPNAADFTISIATPPTVDQMCKPADTQSTWSCRNDKNVALNSDRWQTMTPTYTDLAEYRAYMVNHEVGHFLGHDHETCGGAGQPAPVMLQQSKDLGGCAANAWPTVKV